MKRITIIVLVFFATGKIDAQQLFFNIAGGMINYGGDLQEKLFTFNQANRALSAGASYKFSKYISVSAAFTSGKLAASDLKTNSTNSRRNLSFYSNLTEGSLTLEAGLNDVPNINRFTPYLFGGVAIFHFNPYAYDLAGNKVYLQPLGTEGEGLPEYPQRKEYKLTQFALPFGGGIKYAISNSVIISAEFGFRKLFTDYLDDVSKTYADTGILRMERGPLAAKMSFRSDEINDPVPFSNKIKRGNPTRKDVYYLCLIKLSFSLGKSGASNNGYSRKMRKQAGCPQKVL
jgi:opacity protein-like surface antigen